MKNKKTVMKGAVDELNAKLWKACDTFRGTIDSALYTDYILAFLFLKYISEALLHIGFKSDSILYPLAVTGPLAQPFDSTFCT